MVWATGIGYGLVYGVAITPWTQQPIIAFMLFFAVVIVADYGSPVRWGIFKPPWEEGHGFNFNLWLYGLYCASTVAVFWAALMFFYLPIASTRPEWGVTPTEFDTVFLSRIQFAFVITPASRRRSWSLWCWRSQRGSHDYSDCSGKLKPKTWDEFERAYKDVVTKVGKPGLRGRWLAGCRGSRRWRPIKYLGE